MYVWPDRISLVAPGDEVMQPSTVDRLKLHAPETQALGEAAMQSAGFDAEE
jgi:hypothetical protein